MTTLKQLEAGQDIIPEVRALVANAIIDQSLDTADMVVFVMLKGYEALPVAVQDAAITSVIAETPNYIVSVVTSSADTDEFYGADSAAFDDSVAPTRTAGNIPIVCIPSPSLMAMTPEGEFAEVEEVVAE